MRSKLLVVLSLVTVGVVAAVGPTANAEHAGAPFDASSPPGELRADASRLSLGHNTACVILDAGTVRCWGNNNQGQVGIGIQKTPIGANETPDSFPTLDLGGLRALDVVTSENHSCARLIDRSVRCWGGQTFGPMLGVPGSPNRVGDNESPTAIPPVSLGLAANAIAVGNSLSCALLEGGSVRCWGDGSRGQLGQGNRDDIGDNETPASVPPVALGPGRTAQAIDAGRDHACALLDDGTIRCWGERQAMKGQAVSGAGSAPNVGDDEPASAGPLVTAADLGGQPAIALSAGDTSTCAVNAIGEVYCWGAQEGARLSTGANVIVPFPTKVNLGGRTAAAIDHGFDHVCVLFVGGTVGCWGLGGDGRLGYGDTETVGDNEPPLSKGTVDLGVGRTATAISAGANATCALLDNDTVRCWGDGANGAIGSGNTIDIGDNETPGSVPPVNYVGTAAFRPLNPARVLDTRANADPGPKGIIQPGGSIDVQITGVGGVPTTNVYAVVLNVTLTQAIEAGFVTAHAEGSSRPNASNINVAAGKTAPNSVIVPVSATGKVTLFTSGGGHMIADVFGYFEQAASSTAGRMISVSPARVFDTRELAPAPGPKGILPPGATLEIKVTGANNVPNTGVSAVVLNVTAAGATDAGFVTVHTGDQPRPGTSNINLSGPGDTRPNTVIVPVGAGGTVKFFTDRGTHLLADVTGYFTDATAPDTDDGLFARLTPTRLLDTRTPDITPIPAGGVTSFAVTGLLGIPSTANGVALNLTATNSLAAGFVTGWPSDEARGNTSNLNIPGPNETIANLAILPLRQPSGSISLFTERGTNLLADTSGYFL